jgi:hypothetical protein
MTVALVWLALGAAMLLGFVLGAILTHRKLEGQLVDWTLEACARYANLDREQTMEDPLWMAMALERIQEPHGKGWDQ